MVKLTIPIDAVPQERPRVYNRVAVDPPKSKKFKQDFATLVKSLANSAFFSGELKVELHIFRNFNRKSHAWFGDIDN